MTLVDDVRNLVAEQVRIVVGVWNSRTHFSPDIVKKLRYITRFPAITDRTECAFITTLSIYCTVIYIGSNNSNSEGEKIPSHLHRGLPGSARQMCCLFVVDRTNCSKFLINRRSPE